MLNDIFDITVYNYEGAAAKNDINLYFQIITRIIGRGKCSNQVAL